MPVCDLGSGPQEHAHSQGWPRPSGCPDVLTATRGKPPVGPDHQFSCGDSRPGPIATDAPRRAPSGPVTRPSAPLIINNLPTAPDVGNAKKASRQRCEGANVADGRQRVAAGGAALPPVNSRPKPQLRPRAGRNFPGIKMRKWRERLPREGTESPSPELSPGGNHMVGEALPGTAGDRAAPEGHGAAPRHRPCRAEPVGCPPGRGSPGGNPSPRGMWPPKGSLGARARLFEGVKFLFEAG